MIYTCTLNPSIDYVLNLDSFELGKLNRSKSESFHSGGKGINVSVVLSHLGLKSKLIGYLGGYTGAFIEEELKKQDHLLLDFIQVEGNSRINIKLKGMKETEINASGPNISKESYMALLKKVNHVTKGDIFILSGNIPSTINPNIYRDIAQIVTQKGAILIVDSSKELLLTTLEYRPFLIKPNKVELEELFGVVIETDQDIIRYAKELMKLGVHNVLVSLGSKGAMLVTSDKIFRSYAPEGQLINSVGAGDSMVAGFIYEYLKTKSYKEALITATACGSATAFSVGLATKNTIDNLKNQIRINQEDELDENN